MVDYSKWAKFDVDSDEEDAPKKPTVHRLEGAHSVTIGGRKDGVVTLTPLAPPAADSTPEAHAGEEGEDDEPMEVPDEALEGMEPGDDFREDILQCRALAERALQAGDAAEGVRLLEKAFRLGGPSCPGLEVDLEAARRLLAASTATAPAATLRAVAPGATSSSSSGRRNGGEVDGRYRWSQTRDSVEVFIYVADDTKAKSVSLKVTETSITLAVDGVNIMAGEWEFKVVPEEDPDWELRDCSGRRAVRLSVNKAPIPGGFSVVCWWTRVLKGEPSIDVEGIEDRKAGASESFVKAWADAHVQFREQAAARKPIVIDDEGNVCDEDMAVD